MVWDVTNVLCDSMSAVGLTDRPGRTSFTRENSCRRLEQVAGWSDQSVSVWIR